MTTPTTVLIGDPAAVTFNGLESPWIVLDYDAREEITELQPGDSGPPFNLTQEQWVLAKNGYIRKRRITETYTFYNKFLKSTVDQNELRALANPAMGPLTITVENLTFTGYLDNLHLQYSFQGDLCEITIALFYQYPWSLVYGI